MSEEKLFIVDFVDKSVDYLESTTKIVANSSMSFNRKVRMLNNVLNKGIAFGLSKGAFVYKSTQGKIKTAKDKAYENWIDSLIYSCNEEIEERMIKTKYKKKLTLQ